jgi:hypothetical protein
MSEKSLKCVCHKSLAFFYTPNWCVKKGKTFLTLISVEKVSNECKKSQMSVLQKSSIFLHQFGV